MVLAAWVDGFRRVLSAPATWAGACFLTWALAVPLTITLGLDLRGRGGESAVPGSDAGESLWEWWQEFSSRGDAVAATFTPAIVGFASTLDSLSRVLDRQAVPRPLIGTLALYSLGWIFVSGGLLDRYARRRPTKAYGFFAACGGYFPRLFRLALISATAYALLFAYVYPWLFDRWLPAMTRGVAVERTVFLWRLLMYVIFGLVLGLTNLLVDYARIRTVVEDRRSMIGAVLSAIGFIRRTAARVLALYAVNALTFVVFLAVWLGVAPGVNAPAWVAIAITQLYLLVRVVLKLQFMASQTSLFQHVLAHAGYTAAPSVDWPESPMVAGLR